MIETYFKQVGENSKMNFYTFLKSLGFLLHSLISQSSLATKIYIKILSLILKPIPFNQLKQRILNSINSVKWPQVELEPQNVLIGTNTTIKVIPHFYEFDLQSLFSYTLNYEKEVFNYLEQHLNKFDVVIEIGANIGIFSMFFYKGFVRSGKKGDHIFVFEPSREAYFRLLKNFKTNKINNIQAFNCAIGSENDFSNFFEPEGHLTNGSLDAEFAENFSNLICINKTFVINGQLLEKLIDDKENILIKIDAEGSELSIIKNFKALICQKKPVLLIEVLPRYQDDLNELSFLLEMYEIFNITSNGLIKHKKFQASQFRDYLLLPFKYQL